MNPLPTSSKFRSLFEMSGIMMNNDEYAVYTDFELDPKKHAANFQSSWMGSWSDPKLVFSRPVYQLEIKDGLLIREKPISSWDEKVPRSTKLIDAIYKFKGVKGRWDRLNSLRTEHGAKKLDLSQNLADYVAYSYYDCLSGGMPTFEISIVRFLIDNLPGIDMNSPVYPSSEGKEWYTLRDFYDDVAAKAPNLMSETRELLGIAQPLLLGPVKVEEDRPVTMTKQGVRNLNLLGRSRTNTARK